MNDISTDIRERQRALTLDQSFIVRAPAGSGKTDLLTRRFLKLLTAVDEPEEILAITFTRAATAEMRARVLHHLEEAARIDPVPDEDERIALARAALSRSEARGWRLLEQPHRLNIETIDSLCLRIAHSQPLLSRMGGRLSPSENAGPLYALAARRTLGRLGSTDPQLEAALTHLLELRDNNLADCEQLIVGMLERRDQWIRAFPLTGNMSEAEWEQARSRLEKPFREEVKRVHARAHELLTREPWMEPEIVVLMRYAIDNGNQAIAPLAGIPGIPKPELAAVEHWYCIADFLLTKEGDIRKRVDKNHGFPVNGSEERNMKGRMGELLRRLSQVPELPEVLAAVREAPLPRYEEVQWETLRHIFMTLRQAVAELRVLFAEQNTVDFTELSLAARGVLRNADASQDMLLALSGNIRHLLVDEFQDTSRSQHELLLLLVRAWDEGDGRTCFFVGDPMQSVYLFRQAEVELFEQVTRDGLAPAENKVVLEPLKLLTNFRSHEGLTARWNEMFEAVFEPEGDAGTTRVGYTQTVAAEPALPGEAVHVYPQIIGDADRKIELSEKELAAEGEAKQVLAIIGKHRERIERAVAEGSEYRVAVLVRSRPHLAKIVAFLRERGIPFRAVELEKLNERQELLDLLSLVRALLHPMDRVAWLSALRAPWCGLTLEDLHVLTGADDRNLKHSPMLELMESRMPLLSQDGAARLQRVAAILKHALEVRFQGMYATSFSQWIERTWRSLGGAHCIDAAAYENTQVFFAMLDEVSADGMECLKEDFEAEMSRLYAPPDPRVSERAGVQLMTIHKAKGLGFDVVIVPGLDRRAAEDKPQLIVSLERTNAANGETEMLVAPIGYRGDEKHPTYNWVQKQRNKRADEELKRLLYVACTRARSSLHLLGTATMTASGLKPGDAKSLLTTAWPALKTDFEAAQEMKQGDVVAFPERSFEEEVFDIAASHGAGIVTGGEQRPKLMLRRLPANAELRLVLENVKFAGAVSGVTELPPARPEGSRDARQKGSVVHALLERMSRGTALDALAAQARSLLRALAYSGTTLEEAIEEVLAAVKNCMNEADGAWILAPHAQAQSEASWTEWNGGALESLRADRVFVAGSEPRVTGEDHLWVVDYKMSAPAGDVDFLLHQREIYTPQLARYARVLRESQRIDLPVRFGLYYPRIPRLDWWSPEGL